MNSAPGVVKGKLNYCENGKTCSLEGDETAVLKIANGTKFKCFLNIACSCVMNRMHPCIQIYDDVEKHLN